MPPQEIIDVDALNETEAVAATTTAPDETGVGETSFDDDSIQQFDFELYKGRKNQVDRIAILNPERLKYGRAHYIKEKGYFLCASEYKMVGGKEIVAKAAICCKKLDDPKKRFSVLVVQYTTNSAGQLQKPLAYTLKLWRFSEDKFVQLRDIHKEFPLGKHDLIIRCSEETFQKMTISAAKESIIRVDKFPKAQLAEIMAWATSMAPKAAKAVGRKLTEAEMLERLGLATSARTVASETVVGDLDALLPND